MTDLISREVLLKEFDEYNQGNALATVWRIRQLITNAPAIEQGEVTADTLEELERALCVIGVVGNVDGHDVIRRESVINVARQRIKAKKNDSTRIYKHYST